MFLKNMNYCIIPTIEINNINFAEVVEFRNTLRYSLDGSEFILKYDGTKPETLKQYNPLNHQVIRAFINNPANGWINI
tara:strand:+ start:6270 stop:6503 length:234 start_codon:yes stop_codon:yes gene_type:complete